MNLRLSPFLFLPDNVVFKEKLKFNLPTFTEVKEYQLRKKMRVGISLNLVHVQQHIIIKLYKEFPLGFVYKETVFKLIK